MSLISVLKKLTWEKEQKLAAREAKRRPPSPAKELKEDSEPVTVIGQYIVPLALSAIEGERRSVLCTDSCTGEQFSCRVYNYRFYQSKAALFSSGYVKGVHPIREVLLSQSRSHVFAFSNTNYGYLHQYLRGKKRLSEVEAAPLFRQIVELVRAAHSQKIALRDIKLKKFIFEDDLRTSLSLHYLDDAELMDDSGLLLLADYYGCPAYVCPEMLQPAVSYSGKAADLWSLGVILYTLLVGQYPFFHTSIQNLFSKIRSGGYQVPDHVSELARSLISSLLAYDPNHRVPAWAILDHPWFKHAMDGNFTPVPT